MASFRDTLDERLRVLIDELRSIIKQADTRVIEVVGPMMSAKDALLYKEQGVMKYALAQTKSGFTFHSMVMYANPDIFEMAKPLTGVKLQKGCLNIADLTALDLKVFAEFLSASAGKDFAPVIAHYHKKNR